MWILQQRIWHAGHALLHAPFVRPGAGIAELLAHHAACAVSRVSCARSPVLRREGGLLRPPPSERGRPLQSWARALAGPGRACWCMATPAWCSPCSGEQSSRCGELSYLHYTALPVCTCVRQSVKCHKSPDGCQGAGGIGTDRLQQGVQFSVVVTEGRPDETGLTMARTLDDMGVPVDIILDSAIAYALERFRQATCC